MKWPHFHKQPIDTHALAGGTRWRGHEVTNEPCHLPSTEKRALYELLIAHHDELKLMVKFIMDQLMKELETAKAEITDRKAEHASMKAALDLANAEIATLKAAPVTLPAGAMSADQVAAATAAAAALVVAAAP